MRLLALFAISWLVGCSSQQNTAETKDVEEIHNASLVDYNGFLNMTEKLADYRQQRLITVEEFNRLAKKNNTIILDTRSKAAFDDIHIKGAIHLNFSDFTQEKLAKIIPNKNTRILIYCNNNFISPLASLQSKSLPLALNIPTFINLHGYGYENIYELGSLVKLPHPDIELEGTSFFISTNLQ